MFVNTNVTAKNPSVARALVFLFPTRPSQKKKNYTQNHVFQGNNDRDTPTHPECGHTSVVQSRGHPCNLSHFPKRSGD